MKNERIYGIIFEGRPGVGVRFCFAFHAFYSFCASVESDKIKYDGNQPIS